MITVYLFVLFVAFIGITSLMTYVFLVWHASCHTHHLTVSVLTESHFSISINYFLTVYVNLKQATQCCLQCWFNASFSYSHVGSEFKYAVSISYVKHNILHCNMTCCGGTYCGFVAMFTEICVSTKIEKYSSSTTRKLLTV